jgi:hypothetical protein
VKALRTAVINTFTLLVQSHLPKCRFQVQAEIRTRFAVTARHASAAARRECH